MNNLNENKQEETNWSPEVLDNTRNTLRNSSSSSRFDVNFGNTLSYDVKFDTSLSEVNDNSKEQSQANNGKEHELVRKSSRQLFNQMGTLFETPNGELEWKQTARWVKFEEKVEDGGERWSKPHVASFSLFSLFDLRSLLLNGTTLFDMDATDLETIVENILEAMISQGKIIYDIKERTKDTLLRKHRRLYEKSKFKKKDSMSNIFSHSLIKAIHKDNATEDNGNVYKGNKHFMKKIPAGSEASNILVGEVNYLEKPIVAFVRLSNPVLLEGITEVPVSSRFIFILLGPKGELNRYREIGRAMAILLSDELFTDIIYEVKNKLELMKAIDDFMEAVTVLPPAGWDPSVRIEPPAKLPSQESRKPNDLQDKVEEEEDEMALRQESGLVRTGRIFGGLINDLKRKKPFYLSDFKDGFSIQSIASICFLYFACLSPIITFGGLLGAATDNNIAAMESLIAGLICGVTYGLASGQPLTILGSTGPVLILETILFNFCKGMEWDYMELRFWVGIWAAGILLILVAADASSFVCYITRFTEENFATLIALIFIFEAIEKVINIGHEYPMETNANEMKYCNCSINNTIFNEENCIENGGQFVGDGCIEYFPDIFTFSILLFFGTFFISTWLKAFKNEPYFGSKIRNFISDFSVIIAILSMTMMDYFVGINTPKLNVPEEFKPTNPHRNWVIQPFGKNPWWTPIAAAIPAALACILLFMDQQITAVIVNRKENKLKKGCGYHLDLFILAILIAVNSVMGLPWFVAATVLSINHVNSLKLESETAAPGEKPQFLGVRENRLTHVVIFLLIGGSVLMTPVLKNIPMSVLFGVFLYMGVAALKGIQFFDRILIMFMPAKYQPDYAFLRQVPLKKIHIYTCVQLTCLVILWVIKSFKQTSILFPLMLVVMIGVRKLLDKFFTQRELKILDDALPEFKRKQKIKAEETNSEKINDKKNWPRFRKKSIINISDDPNKNTTYGVVHNNFLGEINGQYDFKMNTQNGIDNIAFVVDNSSKQDLQSDKKSPQEYDIEAKNEDSTIKF